MRDLISVFFEPRKLFAGLPDRRHTWIVPLFANTVLLLISIAVTLHMIGMEQIVRQRVAASSMTPEQMQQAITQGTSPAATYITYAAIAIGTPLWMLLVSGILFAFGLMTARAPKFSAMLAMVSLAFFPYLLITVIMSDLVMIAAPDKTALDVNNILATNIAAFVSKSETSKGLYALYSSLDVLSLLEILFLAWAFSKLTKAGFFAGLGAVGGMWIFYVLIKMGLSLFQ